MLSLAVVALIVTNVALAQTSTVSLLPLFPADGLQGEVIGTGSDGTTYRLVGTFPSLAIPYTGTLVEDATHVAEVAVIATSGVSIVLQGECVISASGSEVSCVEAIVEASSTSAMTLTGVASLAPVTIVSALPTNASSSQVTITSIGSSGSSPISTLPPVLSSPSRSALSSTSPSSLPSTSTTPSDSGASRNAAAGLVMAIPVLLFGLFGL